MADGVKSRTIGVAGCGAMGLPMARALAQNGFETIGFDIRPAKEFTGFEDHMVHSPGEFSKACDIAICVVRDEKQVLDLCFDEQAILAGSNPPFLFVLSSTVSPRFVAALNERMPAATTLIDAPMSGAPQAAIARTLTFMTGGDEHDIAFLAPLFEAMGNKTWHLGPLGAGMAAKVLNNFVAATSVAATRQVLADARGLGIDPQTLLDVMNDSSGQNWFASNYHKTHWAGETHDAANTIGILEKDVKAYLDALGKPSDFAKTVIGQLRTLPRPPPMR